MYVFIADTLTQCFHLHLRGRACDGVGFVIYIGDNSCKKGMPGNDISTNGTFDKLTDDI